MSIRSLASSTPVETTGTLKQCDTAGGVAEPTKKHQIDFAKFVWRWIIMRLRIRYKVQIKNRMQYFRVGQSF